MPPPGASTLVDVPTIPAAPGAPRLRLQFDTPLRWLVARTLADVPGTLDAAHAEALGGRWCVGWVNYEAAPGLDATLMPGRHVHAAPPGTALAAFAVFDTARPWPPGLAGLAAALGRGWRTAAWRDGVGLAAAARAPDAASPFARQVCRIRDLIREGDVYQVNLTTSLESHLDGDARDYFLALHRSQPQGYAFFLPHDLDGCPAHILSVSPELFFHWENGVVTTRPMKGTAPRGASPAADLAAADRLRTSEKERAENLMIVDLLRNDLARVAALGTVRVASLFEVEALPTVWQMTSTVTARTRNAPSLSALFSALFPCGSVTGAPKRSAMEIIHRLEPAPRGVYCGAVGILRPGGSALFNVPIRTVTLEPAPSTAPAAARTRWRAACGIGSGITHDSTATGEAREWLHKQGFLRRAAEPFDLLETLRLEGGRWWLLSRHLARLQRAADHFGVPLDAASVNAALAETARRHPRGVHRVRLRIPADGTVRVESSPLAPTRQPVRLAWAAQPMPDADEFIRHKTTRRDAYAAFAPVPGTFDTLLRNRAGHLTETTMGNIALLIDGRWLTPPAQVGLLPGVYREALVETGRLQEAVLTGEHLRSAHAAAFLNSVRGWIAVDWPDLRDRHARVAGATD
ncbi:MAG: chorismate-binding protein [Betaproteobacteria bacterium]